MKPYELMSQQELKTALLRAIILEYQNDKLHGSMKWGYDAPPSMYVARVNRLRLAKRYSRKFEPVSKLLFQRKLPSGSNWPGTKVLLSNKIHTHPSEKSVQIGCTIPYEHSR